ncbi:hypothetical protein MAUB1S_10520 [Mycolicibacterium aubagnense]
MRKLNDNTPGKISVWIGTTAKNEDEFNAYFDGLENPKSECGIHRDFGVGFIDTDFFGTFATVGRQVISVEELCKEVPCHRNETHAAIVKRCRELGILAGNVLSYCDDATFTEDNPAMRYNDMVFIGTFDDPKKRFVRGRWVDWPTWLSGQRALKAPW